MSEQQSNDTPARRRPGRKPGGPATPNGQVLGVAMNPLPGSPGMVRLDIHLELTMTDALGLLTAAAKVQADYAGEGKPRTRFAGEANPFPAPGVA